MKFLIAFVLSFLAFPVFAQTTLTPNVGLQVPFYQQTNWQVPLIYDLNLLDGILGGTQTLGVGTAAPVVNSSSVFITANTSATAIGNLLGGFNGQSVRIFCGSGDTFTSFVNSSTMKLVTSPVPCSTFSSVTLTNLNGVWTETGRTGGSAASLFYQTVQNASGTAQTQRPTIEFTGTAVASVVDDAGNQRTVVTLTASAGSGVTIQTNGVNNSSQTALNFLNSAATNGLTLTFTNTSGGSVQLGITGTLADAGLTSAYSGTGTCPANQVVNALARNASPTCVQLAFTNLSGTASAGQIPAGTSCGANAFAISLGASLTLACAQPSFANVSGNIAVSQMNGGSSASSSTFWRGDGTWAAVGAGAGTGSCGANQFVTAVNSGTSPTCAQPSFSNVSGNISVSQMNSGTNASANTFWRGDGTWGSRPVSISYVIDGGGVAIGTGSKGFISVPFACTVTGWIVLADQPGSIDVTVKRATYSGFPTTSSISGSNDPVLSSAQKNENLGPLSSWGSTAINAGDVLEFNVASAATVTRVTVTLNATVP